jgi:predicted dehydrogenase
MVEAVREGHEPRVNGVAARPALALVLAILESAASGREVQVAK